MAVQAVFRARGRLARWCLLAAAVFGITLMQLLVQKAPPATLPAPPVQQVASVPHSFGAMADGAKGPSAGMQLSCLGCATSQDSPGGSLGCVALGCAMLVVLTAVAWFAHGRRGGRWWYLGDCGPSTNRIARILLSWLRPPPSPLTLSISRT